MEVFDFEGVPTQHKLPTPLNLLIPDRKALTSAMTRFIEQKIVERYEPGDRGFVSNIFPIIKKDGTARVILNFKELNNYVKHVHFKMDTVKEVISLIQHHYFFASIDFKEKYFQFVRLEDRKWLQFFLGKSKVSIHLSPSGADISSAHLHKINETSLVASSQTGNDCSLLPR